MGYIFAVLLGVPFLSFFHPMNSQGIFILSFNMQLIIAHAIGLIIAMIGLRHSRRVGLGLPFIESVFSKNPVWMRARGVLGLIILVSVGSMILVLLSSIVITAFAMVFQNNVLDAFANLEESTYPSTWKWLLAAFYAGISEELVFRLGLMTILVRLGSLIHRDEAGRPSDLVMWVSIIVAGITFGFPHLWGVLPVPDFWILRFRVVFQNSLIGILLGWLYWRFGLESAILTHILVDIGFYVIFVPVSRSNNLLLIGLALVIFTFIVSWAWKALESDRLITDRLEPNDEISMV
jgi:hypothetical protein